jgi:hypothetical protein
MFPRDFLLLLGLLSATLLSPERPGAGLVTPDSEGRLARKFLLPNSPAVHPNAWNRGVREKGMWNRRDWDDFFVIVRKRWSAHRPPRPVDLSRRNRLVPTEGYSLAELDEAGLSIEQAEYLGLPVDAGRVGSYGPNVTTLREFFRASRSRF